MAEGADAIAAVVREILSAVPAGCSWLRPVCGPDGAIADFRIEATSVHSTDILGRGAARVGGLLSELYPTIVDNPLWQAYVRVLQSGAPETMTDYRYSQRTAGVVADSSFEVTVHRVLDGLLVWWTRVDEARRRSDRTEQLGSLGWVEHDLVSGRSEWSPGMYRIFERDPALGPLSRAEQSAAVLAEDRPLAEMSWQLLDSGGTSDTTVRFRIGGGAKHLRILTDIARDPDGAPLKIYAVVQDVTAREDSRGEIERLSDQLRTRELTALAEHRLAAQLQQMIQPVPHKPFTLAGLRAAVGYLPAESALRVGGDWYHAQTLPEGLVALAVGDVAGHGLDAANGMAHLRFSLVAWLSIGLRDPGVLLGHMNRLCVQLGLTGTAVVGVYDPPSRTLSWARGGHAPPLLTRGGTASELPPPTGLLLGAAGDAEYPVSAVALSAGDIVLFYTDGLVERRFVDPATHLDAVKADLTAAAAADDPLDELRARLHRPSPDDDTCTLAVQVL
ncbi:PP2C family protein-serine/threonine phosphatase [Dactylosporangium sp. CA-139066]|uniref:PP2C family protein-serine/threonine phosphatase n=1 Tax=Dactylosporangium sp. CA-139066 TaxID=3239930 RepID=UPI003D8CEB42